MGSIRVTLLHDNGHVAFAEHVGGAVGDPYLHRTVGPASDVETAKHGRAVDFPEAEFTERLSLMVTAACPGVPQPLLPSDSSTYGCQPARSVNVLDRPGRG